MLSVIIPVYQSAECLERCVHSVMSSSFTGFELILVDDGSTDGSGAICDRLAGTDRRIKVIHRQNGGLSAARNTGIDASCGDYITFIDSDDEIIPSTLSDNMDYIIRHPETDLIEYPVVVHYGSSRQYELQFQPRTVSGDIVFQDWISGGGNTHSYACNKIFRKELFNGIRFPEGETFEDIAICPSIIMRCRNIHYSDKGLYLYYDNTNGISANYRFRTQEPLFRHNMELLDILIDRKMQTDALRLWTTCLNLLTDLCRCADADKGYTGQSCARLDKARPSISGMHGSKISFKSALKYIAASIVGVKSVCSISVRCKPAL